MVQVSVPFRLLVDTRGELDDGIRQSGGAEIDARLQAWRNRFTQSLEKRLSGRLSFVTSVNTVGEVRAGSIAFGLPYAPAELQLLFGTIQAALEAVKWINEHADLAVDIIDSFGDGIRHISPNEKISHGQLIIWPARVSGTTYMASASQNLPDVYVIGSGGRIESAIRQSRAILVNDAVQHQIVDARKNLVRTLSTSVVAVAAGVVAIWFYLSAAADSERRQQALLQAIEKAEQRIVELEKQMAVQAALFAVRPETASSATTEVREVRVATPPPVFVVPPSPPPLSAGPIYQGRPAWIYRTN